MINDYIITCSSTVDLPYKHMKTRGIPFAQMHYYLDGVEHMEDLGASMDAHEFYQQMLDGVDTKTSQVNVEEFCAFFRKLLGIGQDILHISLSSGISGVYNSACIARDMLKEEFPDRKILVVDSLCASSGYGMLVDLVLDAQQNGKSIDEAYAYANEIRNHIQHWFFSMDLTFFVKGGRVSKAAGFFGNMLNICPLLNVSPTGTLEVQQKLRGKKLAIKTTVKTMLELTENGSEYDGPCYISHSDCIEDVNDLIEKLEEAFPKLNGKIKINNIGSTIGCHTGPGTVALFFIGKTREV